MKEKKKYMTIDEQIKHLQTRNLSIPNKENARKYLTRIGYHKLINGYREPFIARQKVFDGTKKFITGTSIEDIYHLCTFDKELRELLFRHLSSIELEIKSKMSDFISRNFGVDEREYLNPNFYKKDVNKKTFSEVRAWIFNTITDNMSKQGIINYYAGNYGYYPFWVVVDILSFGVISRLYSKMKPEHQYMISKTYGVKEDFLESALIVMSLFRNACAHNEIVYKYTTFNFSIRQKDIRYIYDAFNIEQFKSTGKYKKGANDLFAIMIIFKFLLPQDEYDKFMNCFHEILTKLRTNISNENFDRVFELINLPKEYKNLIAIQVQRNKTPPNEKKKKPAKKGTAKKPIIPNVMR